MAINYNYPTIDERDPNSKACSATRVNDYVSANLTEYWVSVELKLDDDKIVNIAGLYVSKDSHVGKEISKLLTDKVTLNKYLLKYALSKYRPEDLVNLVQSVYDEGWQNGANHIQDELSRVLHCRFIEKR